MKHGWSIFFGCITGLIIVTMMAPSVFGLQQFTQWGGMYIDGWCSATIMTEAFDPEGQLPPGSTIKTGSVMSGDTKRIRVAWFSPMHSTETCVAWAQSWCGKQGPQGWQVNASYPYFRSQFISGKQNVCDFPAPSNPWFRQP